MADLVITANQVMPAGGASPIMGTIGGAAAVAAGDLLYRASADGTWRKVDADSATIEQRTPSGIALAGGAAGQVIPIHDGGSIILGAAAALTPGVAYYASPTAGKICLFADVLTGGLVTLVGVATAVDTMLFHPVATGVTK